MTFQGAYEELKRFSEGKYFAMHYELSEYEPGKREYECGVYIAGGKWYHHRTWRGVLELVGAIALPGEEHPLEEGCLNCVHCGQSAGPNHYRNTDNEAEYQAKVRDKVDGFLSDVVAQLKQMVLETTGNMIVQLEKGICEELNPVKVNVE